MTTSRIRELAERHWNGEGDLVHAQGLSLRDAEHVDRPSIR